MDPDRLEALKAEFSEQGEALTDGELAEIEAEENRKGRADDKMLPMAALSFTTNGTSETGTRIAPLVLFRPDLLDLPTGNNPD